jgi:hypothetical protein
VGSETCRTTKILKKSINNKDFNMRNRLIIKIHSQYNHTSTADC